MSRPPSIRWSILTGAVLWTAGLFVVAGLAATWFVYRYPNGPRILHGPFTNVEASMAVAAICMAAGLYCVRRGLSALTRLRDGLARVRTGADQRVTGAFAVELRPLVNDLNAMLDHREQTVRRALSRAGDLAHGLKTPLAVMARQAELGEAEFGTERATALRHEVDRMRRQIDYHLVHARAAASGAILGASCAVADAVSPLARTLDQLHAERGLAIRSEVSGQHVVRVQREDLDEMLGNLMDNACKWGRSQVRVSSRTRAGMVEIDVDDDGPGVPSALRTAVIRRGVRADEAAPGSGLGLAIVADLVELYGGAVVLDTSGLGGTRARLTLPEAADVA
jgi:signal transduction histidine kinase